MMKMALIPSLILLISHQPVAFGGQNSGGNMSSLLSDPRASTFQMRWHGGGAGRREGMAVEPGCLRVYEVRMSDTPAQEAAGLGGPGAQYGRIEFSDFSRTKFTCGLKKSSNEVPDPDVFFIDINHNGDLERDEHLKGIPIYERLDKIHYGAINIRLRDRDRSRIHRVFAWYGKFNDLYLVSHCYMQGRIRLGDKEVTAVLVDYNCDGRYDSAEGVMVCDRIGWDADGDGKIVSWEQHFIGSHLVCDGEVFQVGCTPGGQTLAVVPVEVPMGRLQMPTKNAFVRLVGDAGPTNLRITDGAIDVPAGIYQVDYLYIEEPDGDEQLTRLSKSGRYFEKPWEIRPGVTTKIYRDTCIVTDTDKRNYEARMRELRGEGPQPRIVSLLRKPLRSLDEFNIHFDPEEVKGKRILMCFWDMSQRPSRWCIGELAKREEELAMKDIVTVGVHTSAADGEQLSNWLSENGVTFPMGTTKGDTKQALQSWGVQAQPWLILTDREHIVAAEGFGLGELNARIREIGLSASSPADSNQVVGLVSGPDGKVLSGVRVTEFQTDKDYTTDAEGKFVSAFGPSNERRSFFAVGKRRRLVGVGRLAPGERQVEIKLVPAKIVSGTVVDPDGKPVAGAQVAPLPMTCFHVLTDKQGQFDVAWSPSWEPGEGLCLMVRRVDLNLAALADIAEDTETVEVRLTPALTLTGTVEDPNGKPIPGAKTSISLIRGWGCGTPVHDAITNDQGRFELYCLPQKQEYGVQARAEGFWRNQMTTGVINRTIDREEVGPIILKRPILSISGIVVHASGKGVANIPVHLRGSGQPYLDSQTDAEGRFVFEKVCCGPIRISAKNDALFGKIETEGGAKNVKVVVRPRFE